MVRDEVLEDELRTRLGSTEDVLHNWFLSLRPAEYLRLIEIMSGQLQELEDHPGQGVVRKQRLELIRELFLTWSQART